MTGIEAPTSIQKPPGGKEALPVPPDPMKISLPWLTKPRHAGHFPLAGLVSYVSLFISLMTLMAFSVILSKMEPATLSEPAAMFRKAVQVVKGTILVISDELYVIRDGTGKGVLLEVTASTRISGPLAIGAMVEARIAGDGRAVSLHTIP